MQQNTSLNVSALLAAAWRDTLQHMWFALTVVAVLLGAEIFTGALEHAAGASAAGVAFVINALIIAVVSVGIARAVLAFVDGRRTEMATVVPPAQQVVWYIVVQVLIIAMIYGVMALGMLTVASAFGYAVFSQRVAALQTWQDFVAFLAPQLGVVLGVGAVVLVVIAVIVVRYLFVTLVIVDRDATALRAMRASATITAGHRWKLCGAIVLMALLNAIGMFFVVGLIVTVPLTMFFWVRLYRALAPRDAQPSPAVEAPAAAADTATPDDTKDSNRATTKDSERAVTNDNE